jgi:tetratricopeptide (TPR) repeat protein
LDQEKFNESIQAYDKAIELNSRYAEAWYNKGYAPSKQGNYDEAIKAYDEAIKLNPNYAKAWYNKGIAFEALGKTTDADVASAKAKELGYEG